MFHSWVVDGMNEFAYSSLACIVYYRSQADTNSQLKINSLLKKTVYKQFEKK